MRNLHGALYVLWYDVRGCELLKKKKKYEEDPCTTKRERESEKSESNVERF
jgi:hypothetical protein